MIAYAIISVNGQGGVHHPLVSQVHHDRITFLAQTTYRRYHTKIEKIPQLDSKGRWK